nr:SMC-Scp complex subunit ScpB [bacterium]
MQEERMRGIVEAVLLVSGEAVPVESFEELLGLSRLEIVAMMDAIATDYDRRHAGFMLLRFGDWVQLVTRPEYADDVRRVLQPPERASLSQAALETLSIIAYRQPITRSEVEAVRGVKCDYALSALMDKGLIAEVGRRDTLGRPILYGTTDTFLQHFGLATLGELPGRGKILEQMELLEAARHAVEQDAQTAPNESAGEVQPGGE